MARVKFLCDADRCIECNACVTACKNEHEVPWGINRRRVVTINDGKPGERSILAMACMHCTDARAPPSARSPCFYATADGGRAASRICASAARLLLLRLPVRSAAISPRSADFGSRGKMDKVHLLRKWPETDGTLAESEKYGADRLSEGEAAPVRGDVLDQIAAGG